MWSQAYHNLAIKKKRRTVKDAPKYSLIIRIVVAVYLPEIDYAIYLVCNYLVSKLLNDHQFAQ